MGLLSREAILRAEDLPREEVSVPEWGGSVLVRTLTGAERDRYEADIYDLKQKRGRASEVGFKDNLRAKLVALAACDERGQRLFSDADVRALGAKSAKALERVWNVARRLAGLSGEDVEELEKNSAGGRNGSSGLNCPTATASPSASSSG